MPGNDELILIHVIEETNESGFAVVVEGEKTKVYAEKKSVGYREFFTAQMAGFNEQMKFDVYTDEFDNQEEAEYDGKRYSILRTYVPPNKHGEITELTLADVLKRGR